jgi:endonuclease/exonuclease/phosphatase family metal-dependent hydrolase
MRPVVALLIFLIAGCRYSDETDSAASLRVMTFNIEDLRTSDLERRDHPRLKAAARTIQELRPDILLINEMTYDVEGVRGFSDADGPGQNARRFVQRFLAVSQGTGLEPLTYDTFAPPTNTGVSSGLDLDKDGAIASSFPPPDSSGLDGSAPSQTAAQRAYGNDSWGFGTFPGQYAMALFVAPHLSILHDSIRTFQLFRWVDMPGALRPMNPDSLTSWYSDAEWSVMRLSSKNHVDVPVRLPDGRILHVLASHPTPPAFDGPERRNKLRNHDEIRFWIDYLSDREYFVDDRGHAGGLATGASFVIVGDLNADPDEGSSYGNPARKLLDAPAVSGDFVPTATEAGISAFPELDPDDTAEWGLRIDYVLPSRDLKVLDGGVRRPLSSEERASDHFPVWLDLQIPVNQ